MSLVISPDMIAAQVATSSAAKQPARGTKPDAHAARLIATQVALDRAGFSPGEIDGKPGGNTDHALRAFQQAHALAATGELDTATITRLGPTFEEALTKYTITAEDVVGPFVESIPADMMKKSALPALGYTSVKELLAERFHCSPKLLDALNAGAGFSEGDVLTVPNVEPFVAAAVKAPAPRASGNGRANTSDVARANTTRNDVVITVADRLKTLQVQDATGNVIFHAPVTVGSTHDPLPVGEWKVTGVDRNPSFNYNPDLFWDANPKHSKAKIAAGPNNPVGIVWIDLTKEHYGIHGTPEPSRIGHTESHGCIRLTNWDAARLAALVGPGTRVVLR